MIVINHLTKCFNSIELNRLFFQMLLNHWFRFHTLPNDIKTLLHSNQKNEKKKYPEVKIPVATFLITEWHLATIRSYFKLKYQIIMLIVCVCVCVCAFPGTIARADLSQWTYQHRSHTSQFGWWSWKPDKYWWCVPLSKQDDIYKMAHKKWPNK